MKSTALFCCVVIAALILTVSAEDVSRAQKQYDINFLLWKVNERLRDRDLIALAQTFNPEDDLSKYTDGGDAIHKLMNDLKGQRLLQRKHWFSLFKPRHREEALMLFDVIMNCKDWETAISNAAFFRERMNEGEFVYALYVTVIHYPLAEHIVLPPLYEVTPHLFTNAEVIRKAYNAKMTKTPAKLKSSFTGTVRNREQRVAYFREDIGMNIHHVLWHMEFPFWWKDSYGHKLNRKGETFYWVHHQLTCRFDAERLSNFLPPVEELHWDQQIHEGFAPHTTYKYGGSFPSRPDDVYFKDVDGVARIRDMIMIDSRIHDAIAHGYVINKDGRPIDIMNNNGIDILGDIIESSMYSPNVQYYGALHNTAHIMLGRQADPQGKYGMPPGVMEHFETATRDPGFFRLHKYVDNIFREHKDSLPSYTKDQLDFEGVSVENFAIDGELETFFEDFGYNLINAVDDSTGIDEVEISAYVSRMAHKPFNFSIDINNNKGAEALATVRIFAWPHVDHNGINFSFDDGRWNAIELDKFWIKLQPGDNHIVRGSTESGVTSADVPSFMTLMDRTVMALFMETELDLHEFESATGLPNRFLIPKGHSGGMELDVFIAVTDGEADAAVPDLHTYTGFNYFGIKGVYPDNQPHGYPLDRRVKDERIFHDITNFKHIIVKVYNKGDDTHYDE